MAGILREGLAAWLARNWHTSRGRIHTLKSINLRSRPYGVARWPGVELNRHADLRADPASAVITAGIRGAEQQLHKTSDLRYVAPIAMINNM